MTKQVNQESNGILQELPGGLPELNNEVNDNRKKDDGA